MTGRYKCKCCGRELVPLEKIHDIQVGIDELVLPSGMVCIECDYLIGEDEIMKGIANDPDFDIEEVNNVHKN